VVSPFNYALNYIITHIIKPLERVQWQFTKRIIKLQDLSYQARLTALNLETLEHRRISSDLIMYYKVFQNLTLWVPSDCFNVIIRPYNLHSVYHEFHFREPLCQTNIFANDLFNRLRLCMEQFANVIVNSKHVATFKCALGSFDLSLFFKLYLFCIAI